MYCLLCDESVHEHHLQLHIESHFWPFHSLSWRCKTCNFSSFCVSTLVTHMKEKDHIGLISPLHKDETKYGARLVEQIAADIRNVAQMGTDFVARCSMLGLKESPKNVQTFFCCLCSGCVRREEREDHVRCHLRLVSPENVNVYYFEILVKRLVCDLLLNEDRELLQRDQTRRFCDLDRKRKDSRQERSPAVWEAFNKEAPMEAPSPEVSHKRTPAPRAPKKILHDSNPRLQCRVENAPFVRGETHVPQPNEPCPQAHQPDRPEAAVSLTLATPTKIVHGSDPRVHRVSRAGA
ncbi:hypothetical protein L596_006188 [Steinernema carpocapsae]|uniref:Uncharacterized protein n=1 Tax=Steinernema carpocapsae TaxID=34508 RepID=A0A4U8V2R3_STECR|nr:hypothetical protein L596_006188 [Steinernema carpocapsae]